VGGGVVVQGDIYRGSVRERQVHLVVEVDYGQTVSLTFDNVEKIYQRTANPLMVLLAWYEEIA
jgi:hypothetical protein